MKSKDMYSVMAIGILTGCGLGAGLALIDIVSHRDMAYGMYGLALDRLQHGMTM